MRQKMSNKVNIYLLIKLETRKLKNKKNIYFILCFNKMAQYKSEYSKPSVGMYSQLGCYLGSNPTMPPLKPGTTSGAYLTPDYPAIGYDALTHGVNSSDSYFNIQNAYGPSNCSTTYTSRLCGSDCGKLGGQGAFRCNNGQCVPAQKGTQGAFATIQDCQNNCNTRGGGGGQGAFRCNNGQCVPAQKGTQGAFATIQECRSNCKIPLGNAFRCDQVKGCIMGAQRGTKGAFDTIQECQNNCNTGGGGGGGGRGKSGFNCVVSQGCVPAHAGTKAMYSNLDECGRNCNSF